MLKSEWSGEEWQVYCQGLLSLRHGEGFQRVPDKDQGDWGIEGYLASKGIVYQCYAADDVHSFDDLYSKQRDKITADLSKLVKNLPQLSALMPDGVIKQWVFLVPELETKRIIAHSAAKSKDLCTGNLTGLCPQFHVLVHTADDYQAERARLHSPAQILLFEQPQTPLTGPAIQTIRTKLSAIPALAKESDLNEATEALARHLVRSASRLDSLRRKHPPVWERVAGLEKATADTLVFERLTGDNPSSLNSTVDRYKAALRATAPGLSDEDSLVLAWGQAADWVVRCPLSFA
jgi:hypothetical protein